MIVREPAELAYLREQEAQSQQSEVMEVQRGFDALALEEIVKRWGIRDVLTELEAIHEHTTPNDSKLIWRISSQVCLTERDENPNPCNCDEF